MSKDILIIGAGPAGLTAAVELLRQPGVRPIILETAGEVGGLSKTLLYQGNRIDFGGHRFFSKSKRVNSWWTDLLPLQGRGGFSPDPDPLTRANPDPEQTDRVMLIRKRVSRILHLRQLFNYPLTLDWSTFAQLGPRRSARIAASYIAARLPPRNPERSLEDLMVNRFGSELYRTFFQNYTEKVWGVPCREIPSEWGVQRIKGLSLGAIITHAVRKRFFSCRMNGTTATETSLIDQFWYPKYGPGQLWEEAAREIVSKGGRIHLNHQVTGIKRAGGRLQEVQSRDIRTGSIHNWPCHQVFSSMPVQDLIAAMMPVAPAAVRSVASGLRYRDLILVGLLVRNLLLKQTPSLDSLHARVPDQWIYVQEPDVQAGRIQIFNNWSPYLVADPSTVWIGVEYFCNENDGFWRKSDPALADVAIEEMVRIGVLDRLDVIGQVVLRVPKAYPAYFGSYNQFETIREWTDSLSNLYLIGRNGMHRYNNMDHSMLTAMEAVACASKGHGDKSRIWSVNADRNYHE